MKHYSFFKISTFLTKNHVNNDNNLKNSCSLSAVLKVHVNRANFKRIISKSNESNAILQYNFFNVVNKLACMLVPGDGGGHCNGEMKI